MLKLLVVVTATLMMSTGCSPILSKNPMPSSALVKCPEIKGPKNKSQKAKKEFDADLIRQYTVCAINHNAVVDFYNGKD